MPEDDDYRDIDMDEFQEIVKAITKVPAKNIKRPTQYVNKPKKKAKRKESFPASSGYEGVTKIRKEDR